MAPTPSIPPLPRTEPSYFPYPYSLDPLPNDLRIGLKPVGAFALLSVISTFALFSWITYRLISWQSHYRTYVGYNQYVVLIYNLILADMMQSISFLFSFHWISIDKIIAPTGACYGQAGLLHMGDVSSGFFVLAIAIHTWLSVVKGYRPPYGLFVSFVVAIWSLALVLTIVGPLIHRDHFFTRAGAWCWISQKYETERLWLHYIWIFIDEFGTMIIYGVIFVRLRGQLKSIVHMNNPRSSNASELTKAARYMVLYPAVYVILTLPLAAGRMAAMTGITLPDTYYCVAGSLMTSCGWLDALLYTLTRRVLISTELMNKPNSRGTNSHSRPTVAEPDPNISGWEIHSFDKATANGDTVRTVTITGGNRARDGGGWSGGSGSKRGRSRGPASSHARSGSSVSPRVPSPVGSGDSVRKLVAGLGGVTAETKLEVHIAPAEESDADSGQVHLPARSQSQSMRFKAWS